MDYPLNFHLESAHISDKETWETKVNNHSIKVGVPKEFGGKSTELSPEDLFLAAITNCFIATFKVIAKKNEFRYEYIKIDSELVIDKNKDKKLHFSQVNLDIKLKTDQKSKVDKIIKITENNCLVHNSVNTKINTNLLLQ